MRDSMQSAPCAIASPSLRPSVRLSHGQQVGQSKTVRVRIILRNNSIFCGISFIQKF